MNFRFRWKQEGGHVHVRVFSGKACLNFHEVRKVFHRLKERPRLGVDALTFEAGLKAPTDFLVQASVRRIGRALDPFVELVWEADF